VVLNLEHRLKSYGVGFKTLQESYLDGVGSIKPVITALLAWKAA
jgi:hypothetical protein